MARAGLGRVVSAVVAGYLANSLMVLVSEALLSRAFPSFNSTPALDYFLADLMSQCVYTLVAGYLCCAIRRAIAAHRDGWTDRPGSVSGCDLTRPLLESGTALVWNRLVRSFSSVRLDRLETAGDNYKRKRVGGSCMKCAALMFLCLCFLTARLVATEEKPTSFPDAQSAIDANLRTPEGRAFDEKMGTDFVAKHLGAVRQCKPSAEGDLRDFWILLKLNKDGAATEALLYPSTKLGTCSRTALLKDKFLSPPRDGYWVGIFLKLSH